MPVTIRVADHKARPVNKEQSAESTLADPSQKLLSELASNHLKDIGPILVTGLGQQTSLPEHNLQGVSPTVHKSSLVHAAYEAYSQHHSLVLRPEDVWFAILIQFSFFVNKNAENLRKFFVGHQGKKGLILRDPGQPDMGCASRAMTDIMVQDITDKRLRDWILPSFTTTTDTDKVIASIFMMGTLQGYYEYVFDMTTCGIPTVTLLGKVSDWKDIRRRVDRLQEYGEEPTQFCRLLQPILDNMVATFTKEVGDHDVTDFWGRIIDRHIDSGSDTLTGWMVAFCFWDEKGDCLYDNGNGSFHSNELFGLTYHTLPFTSVPAAFISVPLTYISPEEEVIAAKLLAGFVGHQAVPVVNYTRKPTWKKLFEKAEKDAVNNGTKAVTEQITSGTSTWNTIQPLSGWWIYESENKLDYQPGSRREFLTRKLANEWNGQALTGYPDHRNNTMRVEEGLPNDL